MAIDWNGHPPLPLYRVKLRRRIRWVLDRHPNLYITATTDGQHATGSYHYAKRAVDFGSNDPDNGPEKKAQQDLVEKFGYNFAELFGPKPFHVKNGQHLDGVYPGHGDHDHIAI